MERRTLANYLMPAPKYIQFKEPADFADISSGFRVSISSEKFPKVEKAVERFLQRIKAITRWLHNSQRNIYRLPISISTNSSSIALQIQCGIEYSIPFHGMDEKYSLTIDKMKIELSSTSSIGIFRYYLPKILHITI